MAATYLLDTSAYWRIRRDEEIRKAWSQEITQGAIALTEATRYEILYSAQNGAERMEMAAFLDDLFPQVIFHTGLWEWIDATQQLLAERSQRSAGVIDLMVAAVAADRDLIVLNDDKDFATVAHVVPELKQQRIVTPSLGGPV
jgi:predicted nucleic acid-binding protein